MNPRITWDTGANILDFPELLTRYDPDAQYVGATNQSLSGKTETTTLRRTELVRIALEVMSRSQAEHEAFYVALLAWWSWAARGKLWTFAYDAEKSVDLLLIATSTPNPELMSNGNFESWASDTDASSWTETLGGAGSAVNRQEDLRNVWRGTLSAKLTQGATGNTTISQNITVTVSTTYRVRFRAKGGTVGRKIKIRITNTTTSDVLQEDGSWINGGFTNEPNIVTTSEWQTLDQVFFTEPTGTTLTVALLLTSGGGTAFLDTEFCYVDGGELFRLQAITLTTSDPVVNGQRYLLRGATDFEEEIVTIDSLESAGVVLANERLKYSYAATDIFRSPDYFPSLEVMDRRKRPFGESGAFRIDFDVTARNYVT